MTTKNIVPQATGEGSIGTSTKRWNNGYFNSIHNAATVDITSALGVLTLTEASNSFTADGTETITSITGWTSGVATIRWLTARTLTYNSTSLILQGAVSRVTQAGDIGIYEMTSAGAREIGYFPAKKNLVASTILESAVATVTISGLSAIADGGYTLHANLIGLAQAPIYLCVNGDTTSSNYILEVINNFFTASGSTNSLTGAGGPGNNAAGFACANCISHLQVDYDLITGNRPTMMSRQISGYPGLNLQYVTGGVIYNNTASDLTSITLTSSGAYFAAGSTFNLYKRGL